MEDSIITKLRKFLNGEIDTECKVVYLLAETRKLFQRHGPNKPPFALKLHCDWALHIALDYEQTTAEFLKGVDDYVVRYFADGNQFDPVVRAFLLHETFRFQLREFMEKQGLTVPMCQDNTLWHKFLECYVGVIENGSLSIKVKPRRKSKSVLSQSLKVVKAVTFIKGKSSQYQDQPFNLSWDISLLNGDNLIVEANSYSARTGTQVLAHTAFAELKKNKDLTPENDRLIVTLGPLSGDTVRGPKASSIN